jgi:hypothetical protein
MPRSHPITGRWSLRDGGLRTRFATRLADRQDAKTSRRLVAKFDELTRADWDDIDALVEVFDVAHRLNASPSALAALRNHPPVSDAVEANAASPAVQAFLSRA